MIESLEEACLDRQQIYGDEGTNRDLLALQATLYAWSKRTFDYGNVHPVRALAAHIKKELDEIIIDPDNAEEIADYLILLLNLVSHSRFSWNEIVEAAWGKYEGKLVHRTMQPQAADGTIEHVRTREKEAPPLRIAASVEACRYIPLRSLEYGVIAQLIDACKAARSHLDQYRTSERERDLLRSQLELVLAKVKDNG